MVVPLFDLNKPRRVPYVTLLLIAVNLFVFAVIQPHGGEDQTRFELEHAVVPCEVMQGAPVKTVMVSPTEIAPTCATDNPSAQPLYPDKNVWLAVVVSLFLHASWLHVLGNCWFLWVFGNNVEDRFGPIPYLLLYLASGIVGTMAHVFANTGSTVAVVGASGAIAGVMGAYLVLFPRALVFTWLAFLLIVFVPIPAFVVLLLWFCWQIIADTSGVAWMSHVGGFAFGALIAWLFRARLGPSGPPPLQRRYRAFPPAPHPPDGLPPGPVV